MVTCELAFYRQAKSIEVGIRNFAVKQGVFPQESARHATRGIYFPIASQLGESMN